jgi:hypothetical protein
VSARPEHAVEIAVRDGLRRSRLTVFSGCCSRSRTLIWPILWLIAAVVASILNWFATLVAAQPPSGLHEAHPSVEDRIAMARAWGARNRR